jgi:hypothetical protein
MTQQSAVFAASDLIDTTGFELLKISPMDSAKDLNLSQSVNLEFSLPIDTFTVKSVFKIWYNDSIPVSGIWRWTGLKSAIFKSQGTLKPSQQYWYGFSTDSITSVWQDTLIDTTYQHTFFTLSEDNFGSLAGQYDDDQVLSNTIYMSTMPLEKKKKSNVIRLRGNREFLFKWLPDGQYKLSGYIDLNNDQRYSPGNLFPFQFAEPYFMMNDTIRIRKRWEVSDIKFFIPGLE